MSYDGKNGNGYQPLPRKPGEPPRASKLVREAERASITGDFYKLAEMHNKQTLELIEVVLAKHTATMLEALHALAAPSTGVTDRQIACIAACIAHARYVSDSTASNERFLKVIRDALFEANIASPSAGAVVPGGWSGWACQYPDRLPRLYGNRMIAEVNCDSEGGDRVLFLVEAAAPEVPNG